MPRFEVYLCAQSDGSSRRLRGVRAVGDALLVLLALWLAAHLVERLSIERVVAPPPMPEPLAMPEMPIVPPPVPRGCFDWREEELLDDTEIPLEEDPRARPAR